MIKPFKHAVGNLWGDSVAAALVNERRAELTVGQKRATCRIWLKRRDLTEIIAGLTAIRDAMPEGE